MDSKQIKIPELDHPISIVANPFRVTVVVDGRIIADTRSALSLREASYPAVEYIPRRDVDTSALVRSEHKTYSPSADLVESGPYRIDIRAWPHGLREVHAGW